MWEVIAAIVGGAISGFIAGVFGAKYQMRNRAGRDNASAQSDNGSTSQAVTGDGNRVAGRDYNEHTRRASLVVRLANSATNTQKVVLHNAGDGPAATAWLRFTGESKSVLRENSGDLPTPIHPHQEVQIGLWVAFFGAEPTSYEGGWTDEDGTTRSFSGTLP